MIKKVFVICIATLLALPGYAQLDYTKQYNNGKALFRDGKYNLAMEMFKPLIAYDQKNPYSEYASIYYAVAAYHQGYKAVAKDMLNQILKLYPNWDKINEVYYWLGKIHFDNRDYFQGLKVFSAIQDKKFEKDIEALKKLHISAVTDLETLRMMHEEYPRDAIIGKTLAGTLSKNLVIEEDKKQLEALIDRFKLKRTDYIPEAPKTFFKDRYSVAVFLPFMVPTLDPVSKRRNQIFLDFYEGLKLAADTLNKQGVNILLRAYDTEVLRNAEVEKSIEKIKKILDTEELKHADLIIGPVFPEEFKIVHDFALENKINIVHPFSNNLDILGINPYAFLFQPSAETLGRESANFLASRSNEKTCMIFYGTSKKDSVMASQFAQQATAQGMVLVASERVFKDEIRKIKDILETATEKDEFGFPAQFTLKKDSVGSIFVASDDPLIYSRVVSAVETRKDSILVMGSENWIDDYTIDLDKYQTLGIVLASPNYMNAQKPSYRAFERKFLRAHGRVPNKLSTMGYECMLFLGNQLKTNGVYFQEGLQKAGVLPGYLSEGFDYRINNTNDLVPFTTFRNGELVLIEKR